MSRSLTKWLWAGTVSAQREALAQAARSIVDQLAKTDDYELALSVCEAVRSSAQKAREYSLLKEWSAKANELKRWQKESQEYREGPGGHE